MILQPEALITYMVRPAQRRHMVENHHLGAIFWIATAWIGPPMISDQTPEISKPPTVAVSDQTLTADSETGDDHVVLVPHELQVLLHPRDIATT
jgi:hypothetical protein